MALWNNRSRRIAELEEKLAAAEERERLAQRMLGSVNDSTHLGIWTAYHTPEGEQDRAVCSDEFRRMLGCSRSELADDIQALGTLIHPEDVQNVFAAYGAAAEDRSGQTRSTSTTAC